jgi:hypothetical protein
MDEYAVTLCGGAQVGKELESVAPAEKDVTFRVPARSDMVKGPGIFDPQRTSHTNLLSKVRGRNFGDRYGILLTVEA